MMMKRIASLLVYVLSFCLLIGVDNGSEWVSGDDACLYVGVDKPDWSGNESFGIGFKYLNPIGWADIIDKEMYQINIPSSAGINNPLCVFMRWSGKSISDPWEGAENFAFTATTTTSSDWNNSPYKDTQDYIRVWYDNPLCRVRLYVQDGGDGDYCEIHLSKYWAVDLVAWCDAYSDISVLTNAWKATPTSNIRSVGIIGGDRCFATLGSEFGPNEDCSSAGGMCITIQGIEDDICSEKVYDSNDLDSVQNTWITSAYVQRSQGIRNGSVNWYISGSSTAATDKIDSECVGPGETWAYKRTLVTAEASTLSISSTFNKGGSLAVGFTWEHSYGLPKVLENKVTVSATVSVEISFSDTKESSTQVSEEESEEFEYSSGSQDYDRECYIRRTTYSYEEPYTCDFEWVDDNGFTQYEPTSGVWEGTVSSYDMVCVALNTTCSSIEIGDESRRLSESTIISHPCVLVGYDNDGNVIFESSFGAQLIENKNNLFDNITYVQVNRLRNEEEEDYLCNVYLTDYNISSIDSLDVYSIPLIKTNIRNTTHYVNLSDYSGALIIPELLLCSVSLWDKTETFECGPFGVGNYGTGLLSARNEICNSMINGSLKAYYIEVEGVHNCIGQLFNDTLLLSGKNLQSISNSNRSYFWQGPGYYSISNTTDSNEFIFNIRALKVHFSADVIDAEWLTDDAILVDDEERLLLVSKQYSNYGTNNNATFIDRFIYQQFRTIKSTFGIEYSQFTWLPGTYGLPYISEIDGSLLITLESNFSRFGYAGNETTANDTLRLLDLSSYVTWTKDINITVPANSTMKCDWHATHGWLNMSTNFTYVALIDAFVADYTYSFATFDRDYLYNLTLNCYQDTPYSYSQRTKKLSTDDDAQSNCPNANLTAQDLSKKDDASKYFVTKVYVLNVISLFYFAF